MSEVIKRTPTEEVDDTINVDYIRRSGDAIREKILESTDVDLSKTAPNVFNYEMSENSLGLNEISNVDMGYAGTSVDFDGEHLSKRNRGIHLYPSDDQGRSGYRGPR